MNTDQKRKNIEEIQESLKNLKSHYHQIILDNLNATIKKKKPVLIFGKENLSKDVKNSFVSSEYDICQLENPILIVQLEKELKFNSRSLKENKNLKAQLRNQENELTIKRHKMEVLKQEIEKTEEILTSRIQVQDRLKNEVEINKIQTLEIKKKNSKLEIVVEKTNQNISIKEIEILEKIRKLKTLKIKNNELRILVEESEKTQKETSGNIKKDYL